MWREAAMFEIEVNETESGTYAAFCRDLRLLCEAKTRDEAFHRMQSLVFFYLSAPADVDCAHKAARQAVKEQPEQKIVFIPPKEIVQ